MSMLQSGSNENARRLMKIKSTTEQNHYIPRIGVKTRNCKFKFQAWPDDVEHHALLKRVAMDMTTVIKTNIHT